LRPQELPTQLRARLGTAGIGADVVDNQVERLSGGQKARLLMAIAAIDAPHILILDEPTNHLDIRHQLEVLALLRNLDMTIITSLHDLNLVGQYTDDVLVLANGRCLAFGPSDQVLTEQLVDRAFGIISRIERLMPSNRSHFTFHLEP